MYLSVVFKILASFRSAEVPALTRH